QYLFKSTDQGRNWKRISGDLTTNDKKKQNQEESGGLSADNTSAENHCTIFTIAESSLDENMIWVGTDDGNLQVTTDGGTTWINVSPNVAKSGVAAQSWVSSIQPSQFDKNTVYATFENHMYGDFNTYLAVSNDLGKTWRMLKSKEFTGFAHKIKEDPINKNLLFLGTEMGLFASLDAGENWFRMKNNIPEYCLVRDIQIHPVTHDLIFASHGRGIFIVDDIRLMRNLTKEISDQDFYLFPTEDVVLNNGKYGWGGPEISGGWNAGNPSDEFSVSYYLKQRLNSGKIQLEIFDENNRLIQTIPGTIRKGINKVSWNKRETPPKVAAGSTKMDAAGFSAPMVLPGKYKVKIKVKDKEYESEIKCVHDAGNKDLSESDRKMVYQKANELKDLFNSINGIIDTINLYQGLLKNDTVAFKKNKNANVFFNDLQKVKADLMATTKTSIFADEERLREKVSKLYGSFCGMESRPNVMQLESIDDLVKEFSERKKNFTAAIDKNLPKNPDIKRLQRQN
ncbi:MAG: WD40/YVTN/BNR-like repeat-containing protein, partial [Bacteroidota bacterium]